MDSELGTDRDGITSLESDLLGRDGGEGTATRPLLLSEQFEKVCPYYMAMGMSYSEFWDGDCDSVKMYRKAYRVKQDQDNFFAYLQGMYIYEAILDLVPVLSARSKSTRAEPYRSEPYDLHAAEKEEAERIRKEKEDKSTAKAKTMMELFMIENNKRFKKNKNKKTPARKEVNGND